MSYKNQGGIKKSSFLYLLLLGGFLIAMFVYAQTGNFDTLTDYWYSFFLFIIGGLLLMVNNSFWRKIGFTVITGCIVALFFQGVF
jgi:hypothetical protein